MSLQRFPRPLAVFKGHTSRGREVEEGGEVKENGNGRGRETDGHGDGKRRGEEGGEGIGWTNVKLLPTCMY